MLTPLDIHNKEFKKNMRGYDTRQVDEFLDDIIRNFEDLYRENSDLKDKIARIEENIESYREKEETLNSALVLAQKTADDVHRNAEKEALFIIEKANRKADQILMDSSVKRNNLEKSFMELQQNVTTFKAQLKGFLTANLELLEKNSPRTFYAGIPDSSSGCPEKKNETAVPEEDHAEKQETDPAEAEA